MDALFLLLGATLGLYLGSSVSLGRIIVCLLASILGYLWAWRRGKRRFFLPPLLFCLALAAIFAFVPLSEGKTSFDGVIVKISDNYFVVQHAFARYYVASYDHHYEVGDIIHLEGKFSALKMTVYESRFDFLSYLKDLGARQEVLNAKISSLWKTPFRLRTVEKEFLSHLGDNGRALLDSLLFGKKDYSSALIVTSSSMNLLYMLSSSGLFYSLFLRLLEKGLKTRLKEETAEVTTFFFALFFLPYNFAKIGVLRAFLMRGVRLLDVHFLHKNWFYPSRIGIVGIILLALDYHNAYNTGFLLGFGISISLYVFSDYLRHKKKAIAKLKSLAFIRLFLLPMSLSSNTGAHVFSLFFGVLLLPLGALTIFLGYLSFFSVPFTGLFEGIADFTLTVLRIFQTLDLKLALPALSIVGIGTYYLVFLLTMFFHEVGAKGHRNIILFSTLGLYAASLLPIVPMATSSVSFINVGQGDCALIQDGLTSVLIDTGGVTSFDIAEETLIPYLRKRRIYHIDCVIASHQDYDHVGGVESLMENYNVKRYVKDNEEFPLTIGRLTFTNYNTFNATEENDKSLVLSLTFMHKKWLFTGDAPIWIEKKIIENYPNLDCDILKVGHHGSDTSTCEEFLDLLTPETAIISCGGKNKYGHPKEEVLERLYTRHIQVRRTDIEGTIVYHSPRL